MESEPERQGQERAGSALLLFVIALGGAGTMVVELGAVRLLAPWFGTSSSVWTNVIGVVLAALALGYALGARLAATQHPGRRLGFVFVLAGAFAAWLPFGAEWVAGMFMPEGVPLHDVAAVLVRGSLAASVILFLPAATALGCAGPLAVEALQRIRGGGAGAAGGRVLAASTLGSLIGTFGTTHVLIPGVGIAWTFVGAAIALTLAGVILIVRARTFSAMAAAPVALFVVGAVLTGLREDPIGHGSREGETLLARVESAMQSLRVIERGEGPELQRLLQVNESLDSFQSVWQPEPGLLPPGYYYNLFTLPLAWATFDGGGPPEGWDALIVGLGAGTAVRVLEGVASDETDVRTVGVEIDAEVVALGEEYFELESDAERHIVAGGLDGRAALRALGDRRFDQVIVDAYANNMEIPPHLATVEAFAEMGARLVDGGYLTINVGGFGADDPVVRAIAASAAVGLDGPAQLAKVPFSRNWVVFVRKGNTVPAPDRLALDQPGFIGLKSIARSLEVSGAFERMEVEVAEPFALYDDSSATDVLQVASIRAAESRLESLDQIPEVEREAVRADEAPQVPTNEDQEQERMARGLLAETEYAEALQVAREIQEPALRARLTAEIMWYAGSLFGALEVAQSGLEEAPNDPRLLLMAIDLGQSVGADEAAAARLERLEGLESTQSEDWQPALESRRAVAAAAIEGDDVKTAALRRAQIVLAFALVLGLAIVGFSLFSPAGNLSGHTSV